MPKNQAAFRIRTTAINIVFKGNFLVDPSNQKSYGNMGVDGEYIVYGLCDDRNQPRITFYSLDPLKGGLLEFLPLHNNSLACITSPCTLIWDKKIIFPDKGTVVILSTSAKYPDAYFTFKVTGVATLKISTVKYVYSILVFDRILDSTEINNLFSHPTIEGITDYIKMFNGE